MWSMRTPVMTSDKRLINIYLDVILFHFLSFIYKSKKKLVKVLPSRVKEPREVKIQFCLLLKHR